MKKKSPTTSAAELEIHELKRFFAYPVGKTVLRSLVTAANPVECLDFLEARIPDMALIICPDTLPLSREAKDMIVGSTLTMGSSVLLLAGLTIIGQPWIPAIGCFFGTLGIMKIFSGVSQLKTNKHRVGFLKTFLACLLATAKADACFSDQEKRQLETILASLDLTAEERVELLDMKAPSLDEVTVPKELDLSQRKQILRGCFSLLYCDGITPEELEAFPVLAGKMGFPDGPELWDIKNQATQAVDEQDEMLTIIGAMAHSMLPPDFSERILDVLLALAAKKETKNMLKRSIRSCVKADESGELEISRYCHLETALMSTYFLGKVLGEPNSEALRFLDDMHSKMCHEVGLEKPGETFRERTKAFYNRLIPELIERFKKIEMDRERVKEITQSSRWT